MKNTMKTDKRAEIHRWHSSWNRETGQNIRLGVCSFQIECAWLELINAGHTESELVQVIRYLKGEIAKGERKPAALRFSSLIGNSLRFDEELELARGAARKPKPPTPQQRAVARLRPAISEPITHNTRSAAELIAQLKAAAGMTV